MTGKEFDIIVANMRKEGMNSEDILKKLSKHFHQQEEYDAIRKLLNKLGMASNITGYECWVTAIRLCKGKKSISITGEVYPKVAKINKTTPHNAERRMRYAMEYVFQNCPQEILVSVFGEAICSKEKAITNKKCLAILAQQI